MLTFLEIKTFGRIKKGLDIFKIFLFHKKEKVKEVKDNNLG